MELKGKIILSIMVLLVVSTFVAQPVLAQESQYEIRFRSQIVGKGGVFWGMAVAVLGDYIESTYGELELAEELDGSVFTLFGSSSKVEGEDGGYLISEAEAIGHLSARWNGHRLNIFFRNIQDETEGVFIEMPGTDLLLLGVNTDIEDETMFDPKEATISFRGFYGRNRINGLMNIMASREFGMTIVNLYITELDDYACFIWLEEEVTLPDPLDSITIPAARIFRPRVSLSLIEPPHGPYPD